MARIVWVVGKQYFDACRCFGAAATRSLWWWWWWRRSWRGSFHRCWAGHTHLLQVPVQTYGHFGIYRSSTFFSQQSAAVVKPCKLSLVFSTPRIRRISPAAAAEGSCFRADPPPCIPKDVETTAGAASLAAVVVAAAGWAWDIR